MVNYRAPQKVRKSCLDNWTWAKGAKGVEAWCLRESGGVDPCISHTSSPHSGTIFTRLLALKHMSDLGLH